MVVAVLLMACGPSWTKAKVCDATATACATDAASGCEEEPLKVALDKLDALASLACKRDDFWVECLDTLEKQARARAQSGCDGERATNRLQAMRALANVKCSSTTAPWSECMADVRRKKAP
jgi:hypothetical protein